MTSLSTRGKLGRVGDISMATEMRRRPPHQVQRQSQSLRSCLISGFPGLPQGFQNTAVTLSGGGAKGSFEMGALHFLRRSGLWESLNVVGICGTSVGSINALGLSEGLTASITKMEKVWLELQTNQDMFVATDWVQSVWDSEAGSIIEGYLQAASKKSADTALSQAGEFLLEHNLIAETVGILDIVPVIGFFVDIIQFIATNELEEVFGDLVEGFEKLGKARYAFSLSPVERLLHATLDFDQIRRATTGVDRDTPLSLRLVSVQAETGALAWMDEHAKLWYSDYHAPGYNADWAKPVRHDVTAAVQKSEQIGSEGSPTIAIGWEDILVQGAMASAAIPAFFPARTFSNGDTELGTFVDGGIREVIPSEVIESIPEVDSVIGISASPSSVVNPFEEIDVKVLYSEKNVAEFGFRALDVLLSQAHSQNIKNIRRAYPESIHVEPHFLVHGVSEIDPGGIRINMAYGYMRAFDEFKSLNGEIDRATYVEWTRLTDRIIRKRWEVWILERVLCRWVLVSDDQLPSAPVGKVWATRSERLAASIGFLLATRAGSPIGKVTLSEVGEVHLMTPLGLVFEQAILEKVRLAKVAVAELVLERLSKAGAESLPVTMDTANSIETWWNDWELHNGFSAVLHHHNYLDRQTVLLEGPNSFLAPGEPANTVHASAIETETEPVQSASISSVQIPSEAAQLLGIA